jgi:hypothetical protein
MFVFLLIFGLSSVHAQTGSRYDVLCDADVEVYSCHAPHPSGLVVDYSELSRKLNYFGAAAITVKLISDETITSGRFKAAGKVLIIENDTIHPKDVRYLIVQARWPQWGTVAQMAAGGAMFFGGVGLIIDGLQWVGGSGGDLGATWTGAVVGGALFGGLGIIAARERYVVMIQEGLDQRIVESLKPWEYFTAF